MDQIIIDYISHNLVADLEGVLLQTDTPLMDSNIIDSVAFLNLVMFLEEQFGITVVDTDLTRKNFETVGAICIYIRSKQPEAGRMAS